MPEETVLDLNDLWTELVKVGIVLQRPAVQIQLLGILFSILLGLLVFKLIFEYLKQRFPILKQIEIGKSKLSGQQIAAALVHYLLAPTIILTVIGLVEIVFEQMGWVFGYLKHGVSFAVFVWLYCLFLVIIYSIFPVDSVNSYRKRLLRPLIILMVIGAILAWFLDLQELSKVTIVNLFDGPVTLGSAFVIVAGLYFWMVSIPLLEKLFVMAFMGGKPKDESAANVISIFIRYFLIVLGVVFIFGYVGFNPTALAAITGGLSVGIGFGLREVISNFVSGVWLLLERSLKPGDVISINGQMSTVTDLGIRAITVLVAQDNSEEIIPNQTLFTQNISTYTKSNRTVKRALVVGASYGCSPDKVIEILLEVAKQNPKVLKAPAPAAFLINFGESSIDFELNFWINNPLMSKPVTSRMACEVWQAFADNNIEIPFPQRDIHIRNDGSDSELDSTLESNSPV